MKNFFLKYKIALILLVVILAGFWAYSTFFPKDISLFEKIEQPVGEELFEVLAILEGINLDGDIFSNPDFLKLQDFETEVPAGRAGRVNPFAPAGGDVGGEIVEPTYKVVPISQAETFLDTSTASTTAEESSEVVPTEEQ